jgi:hypothetical protein
MSVGLKANADGSGAIQVGGSDAITITSGLNTTFLQNLNAPNTFGFKNRLINGAFQIAQRTAGGSATPSAGTTSYVALDRWFIAQTGTTASLYCSQSTPQTTGVYKAGYFGRNSGQTNVPTNIFFGQQIESFNVYDLRGQTATVSFNAFRGANAPASLTVVARFGTTADQSSSDGITGSWTGYTAATASDLSVGTTVASYTYSFSVPSDASEMMLLFYYVPTGTAGANEFFALENVQLEEGTTATSFDVRPYGTELALCQRYYYRITDTTNAITLAGFATSTTAASFFNNFPVNMRIAPTALEQTGTAANYRVQGAGAATVACSAVPSFSSATVNQARTVFTVASGLTAYNAGVGSPASGVTAYLGWNVEL